MTKLRLFLDKNKIEYCLDFDVVNISSMRIGNKLKLAIFPKKAAIGFRGKSIYFGTLTATSFAPVCRYFRYRRANNTMRRFSPPLLLRAYSSTILYPMTKVQKSFLIYTNSFTFICCKISSYFSFSKETALSVDTLAAPAATP